MRVVNRAKVMKIVKRIGRAMAVNKVFEKPIKDWRGKKIGRDDPKQRM